MTKLLKFIRRLLLFSVLTVLTQIGGVVYLLSIPLRKYIKGNRVVVKVMVFTVLYWVATYGIVPFAASLLGRERIANSAHISPVNYMTVVLNRNYVRPELNNSLQQIAQHLADKGISIKYLDANFPFKDEFPLLPHLSHSDGRKLDIAFVYETKEGVISNKQRSVSGYGVFEAVRPGETNQPQKCITSGHIQYDFPKYLTFGTINPGLVFSEKGTRLLLMEIVKHHTIEKVFIEPHLKHRLGLGNNKIRYHGCRAVRHDDHIHIQIRK